MKTIERLDEALRRAQRRPGINILRVAAAVQDGETITFGSTVFEIDFSAVSAITAGRTRVNLSGSATLAAASKVLTFAANIADGDTVTIGATTYTFKTALTAPTTAGQVLIGADLTASRDNLVAAIMAAAGAGTTYGSLTTANASVSAVATSTDAITATAKAKGTVGNSIAIAEASTQLSWAGGAVALSGGVDATAGEFTTALAALTPENIKLDRISANEVLFTDVSRLGTVRALACSDTMAGSNNAWAAANTYGYEGEPDTPPARASALRVPNATEVALGTLHVPLSFVPTKAVVQVRVTSTGAVKAWGGLVTITSKRVTLTNNGTADFAATDTITLDASE